MHLTIDVYHRSRDAVVSRDSFNYSRMTTKLRQQIAEFECAQGVRRNAQGVKRDAKGAKRDARGAKGDASLSMHSNPSLKRQPLLQISRVKRYLTISIAYLSLPIPQCSQE